MSAPTLRTASVSAQSRGPLGLPSCSRRADSDSGGIARCAQWGADWFALLFSVLHPTPHDRVACNYSLRVRLGVFEVFPAHGRYWKPATCSPKRLWASPTCRPGPRCSNLAATIVRFSFRKNVVFLYSVGNHAHRNPRVDFYYKQQSKNHN